MIEKIPPYLHSPPRTRIQSFENITSIEHSLHLLRRFQAVLQRESLKSDLDSKLTVIFQNYGMELEQVKRAPRVLDSLPLVCLQCPFLLPSPLSTPHHSYPHHTTQVQQLYEKQMNDPPLPRNMPPVAGNIAWAWHLYKASAYVSCDCIAWAGLVRMAGTWTVLFDPTHPPSACSHTPQRIEAPMKQFERNQNVLAGREAKKIIRMYNKIARTLVEFEFRWQAAWEQSVERAKGGACVRRRARFNVYTRVCMLPPSTQHSLGLTRFARHACTPCQACTPPSSCGTPTTAGCT